MQVAILDYSEVTVRRAAGLQVDSQVLLTGSAVDTASAVNAKISDTTALAANIQAEAPTGSAMKTVAVTSSSGTMVKVAADTTQVGGNGMTAQVDSSNDSHTDLVIVLVVCSVFIVCVGIIGGGYMFKVHNDKKEEEYVVPAGSVTFQV